MSYAAKLIGGRSFTVDATGGIPTLKRTYQIDLGPDPKDWVVEEEDILASVTGLPKLKKAYSEDNNLLLVSGYTFTQGEGNEKRLVTIEVSYSVWNTSMSEANKPMRGASIEALGWRSGSISRDLVKNLATDEVVLNSAGQPFDSVPQVDIPSPVFTKAVKTAARKADWLACYGCINAASVTIGGVEAPAHGYRCVQADEEKLFNDDFGYLYKYTLGFQRMTNEVKVAGASKVTDIGWDLAIVDTGTQQLVDGDEALAPITTVDKETGNTVTVTSPVLLDGHGKPQLAAPATPYVFQVQAYPAVTFPEAMYSEDDDDPKPAAITTVNENQE